SVRRDGQESADRYRARAGAHRPAGRLFREPEAVPERGLLFGDHLRSHEIPDGHVSRAICHRPDAGVAGTVAGDAARQGAAHRSAAANLLWALEAGLRSDRKKKLASRRNVTEKRHERTSRRTVERGLRPSVTTLRDVGS